MRILVFFVLVLIEVVKILGLRNPTLDTTDLDDKSDSTEGNPNQASPLDVAVDTPGQT